MHAKWRPEPRERSRAVGYENGDDELKRPLEVQRVERPLRAHGQRLDRSVDRPSERSERDFTSLGAIARDVAGSSAIEPSGGGPVLMARHS